VSLDSIWIVGATRSGKTARLIEELACLIPEQWRGRSLNPKPMLVFAANGDNRIDLVERIAKAGYTYPLDSATPLGFIQKEVTLFWPLIAAQLRLNVVYPLRLRPETEQQLATRLWQADLEMGDLQRPGVPEYYLVRRVLDLLQIAASSETPLEDIAVILKAGIPGLDEASPFADCVGEVLLRWRQWCLQRGLLTYGLMTELYWRYLLPHPTYQTHLRGRYHAVLADDVDDYPAIARSLFTTLLESGIPGRFTYNPDGAVRWGLGADPDELAQLSLRSQQFHLDPPQDCIAATWGQAVEPWLETPSLFLELPPSIQSIQTVSRAQLLRQTAEVIVAGVESGAVQPDDIAVIGPGFDAIARYTLRRILASRQIAVRSLNDQQPLASSPMIRALLTLLALVYPGLGRLLNREAVAEMLVVLSQSPGSPGEVGLGDRFRIDPVRAGLLTDHCFIPDFQTPQLVAIQAFPRWDRLGYLATTAYEEILIWIQTQQEQMNQRLLANPVSLLDRAIQRFLYGGNHLPYDQVSALRELMETAQHFWQVEARLTEVEPVDAPSSHPIAQFIELLRNGTITADPYPVRPIRGGDRSITLATIFQYRAQRCAHRWHFWLDAGSPLWLTGGGALFGAPLFLKQREYRPWTTQDEVEADRQRLQRQILDLMGRVSDRIFLCHSDLATNGQEQAGPLLSLVNAATPVSTEGAAMAMFES
jgi:hypothetical protein